MTITAETLLGRAKAMIPALRERAAEDAARRNVRAQTVAELAEAGLYRALMPKRWGGFEMPPGAATDILVALGEGDLSVAWICGIYSGHSYHLARFDPRAQEDVWAKDPNARIVSPYMPQGRATPVPGGFRLSGHWRYSSGSMHSHWAVLGGLTTDDPPEYRIFLVPRADYEIKDTWSVMGLEATGSHDLVINGAFVPAHRTQIGAEVFGMESAGLELNDNALYRVPFYQVASRNLSSGQIGALKAMLTLYTELTVKRVNVMGGRVALDPDAQYAAAQALSAIDEMTGTMHRTFDKLMGYAEAKVLPPLEERLLFRYQSAEVAERCLRVATDLFQAAGGGAIYNTAAYGMIYRNIHAARAHIGNNFREMARRLGSVVLGQPHPPQDVQL